MAAALSEIIGRTGRINNLIFVQRYRGNGERHRDMVLALASGEFVAQIAYDDLWFPDHLKELGALLAEVEFGKGTCTFLLDVPSSSGQPVVDVGTVTCKAAGPVQ